MGIRRLEAPIAAAVNDVQVLRRLNLAGCDTEVRADVGEMLIPAATEFCENYTRRAFISQKWEQTLATWGACIQLARPPLIAIELLESFADGVWTAVDPAIWQVRQDSSASVIRLQPEKEWPEVPDDYGEPIRVVYTAGYGLTYESVPRAIQMAIMCLVGHWYVNREAVVTGTISKEMDLTTRALLDQYRVRRNPQTQWIDHATQNTTRELPAPRAGTFAAY